jgi:hypothetical protein
MKNRKNPMLKQSSSPSQCSHRFGIVVAVRPADFRITRTATVSSPTDVFAVNDFIKCGRSPWPARSAAKSTFEGPAAGTRPHSAEWNNQVGEGE